MSSALRSLTSSLSTAVHEVLTPNKTYRCQLEDIVLLRSDKSHSEGIGFKWRIHYKNKEGANKSTLKTENFWLINKEGEPGSTFTQVALKNRLLSLGVHSNQLDHFRYPWEAEDGEHDGSALVDARKWFTVTMEEQEGSEFLQLKIKDPQAVQGATKASPPPPSSGPSEEQKQAAWARKQEKTKKREREEKKTKEESPVMSDGEESGNEEPSHEPEPPKKKKEKKTEVLTSTPAPPKAPRKPRHVKPAPVKTESIPPASPSANNYGLPILSFDDLPPL